MIHYSMVDGEPSAEEYEAQRQANIKANLELMMSLGLYQTTSRINPTKPPTPKTKPKPKAPPASSASSVSQDAPSHRPKRITRSVSRQLETPQRSSMGRGIKRTISDNSISSYYTTKVSRMDRHNAMEHHAKKFNSDDDEYRPSSYYKPSANRRSINPSRSYRDPGLLQRSADRLGVRIHDPKTFGSIPGIAIGTIWEKRMDCSTDAVHAPTVAGISGNETDGCWSICLSGGYEDDIDLGESFTYTGSGGRDLRGTIHNPKNLRTAPQSSDQRWEGKNAALRMSVKTKKPVRVVRGYKADNKYAPKQGYVYSGLYTVTKAWMEKGQAGFKVCKFMFERCKGQAPLPTFDHQDEEEEEEEEEKDEIEEISARSMRALNRSKPSPTSPTHSCSPSPSIRSTCSSKSHHPILKNPTGFDRASYIIISDDSDNSDNEEDTPSIANANANANANTNTNTNADQVQDQEQDEEHQVLLQLEVEPIPIEEALSPRPHRRRMRV